MPFLSSSSSRPASAAAGSRPVSRVMLSTPAWTLLLALGGVAVALAGGKAPESSPAHRLTVLASTANQGEVKDCGCRELPRGGLARRAWFVDSLRTRYGDLLLVDAGDYSHFRAPQHGGLNGFLLGAMADLGYDAITLGEYELQRGADYVQGILDSARVPVVLANVRFKATGAPVGKPYVVCDVGGRRCAVTGLAGRELVDERAAPGAFAFEEPAAVLARLLPEMRKAADLTVVLAHLAPDAAMALPLAVPGIDLLVLGHDAGTVPPTRVGKTVTVRSGHGGQYLAEVHLELGPSGEVGSFTGELVPLDVTTIPESPTMAQRVADLLHALGMSP